MIPICPFQPFKSTLTSPLPRPPVIPDLTSQTFTFESFLKDHINSSPTLHSRIQSELHKHPILKSNPATGIVNEFSRFPSWSLQNDVKVGSLGRRPKITSFICSKSKCWGKFCLRKHMQTNTKYNYCFRLFNEIFWRKPFTFKIIHPYSRIHFWKYEEALLREW